jgi:hypothetical protein
MARVSDICRDFTLVSGIVPHLDDWPWLMDNLARVDGDHCRSPEEDARESGAQSVELQEASRVRDLLSHHFPLWASAVHGSHPGLKNAA